MLLNIGSGGGIARIKGVQQPLVAFGASDSKMEEDDYKKYPDLQMLPSMAGATVLAYNLPGVSQLNMTLDHLVDIYSGSLTYWNDSRLQEVNTGVILPPEKIVVIARSDKSGTTEMFTRALDAHSEEWHNKFGVFNKGIDKNYEPFHWHPSVISMYGNTNRGVSGLVLSVRYSVAYMSLSDSVAASLNYAVLRNIAGNFVEPSVESVQSAMDDFQYAFDKRMTLDLVEPYGDISYPLVGYTYLIVRMYTMTNCKTAEELVRYIEWFYSDAIAIRECVNNHMVPLSPAVSSRVMDLVVKKMTCRGRNIYSMVLDTKKAEEASQQTWYIPVSVSVPLLVIILLLLLLYMARHKIIIYRGLLRNEWRINMGDIVIIDTSWKQHQKSTDNVNGTKSLSGLRDDTLEVIRETNLKDSASELDEDGAENGFKPKQLTSSPIPGSNGLGAESLMTLETVNESAVFSQAGYMLGQLNNKLVAIKDLGVYNVNMNISRKLKILWMKDIISHVCVARFYGMVSQGGICSVREFCSRGSLEVSEYSQCDKKDNSSDY
ncbi:uncharacterized protein LOC101848644 [Aplysia californica]|uniref:Uncharacterized protein LOC101848644 n=1 Tax=Aplysia californica TaxID=6500 RepID=A0ABM1AG50_APLCA|nr:uncharacterized protein LOC101848644 [Aplysia californica]